LAYEIQSYAVTRIQKLAIWTTHMKSIILFVTLLFFKMCLISIQASEIYSIGVIPQFEARHLKSIWAPVITHLEKKTGFKYKLILAPTIQQFEIDLKNGNYDFAYMNPYQITIAYKKPGYIPLTRDIGRNLHGIIVVSRKSEIKTIHDLNGKRILFPSPNALGASLLIRSDLQERYNIEFTPIYVKSHSSVYLSIAYGKAEAGGGVQKTLHMQPNSVESQLKVIYKTKEYSSHPFAVHPRVPKQVREKVRDELLEMGKNEQGQSLLIKIPILKIGLASIENYFPLMKLGLDRYYD